MLIVEDMNENTHNRTFQFNAIARKWPEDKGRTMQRVRFLL